MQAGAIVEPVGHLGPSGNEPRSVGVSALRGTQPHAKVDHRQPMEVVDELEAPGPMGDDPMIPREVREQDGMLDPEDRQWSPACTHMAMSDDDDEQLASGAHTRTYGQPLVTSMHTHEYA